MYLSKEELLMNMNVKKDLSHCVNMVQVLNDAEKPAPVDYMSELVSNFIQKES